MKNLQKGFTLIELMIVVAIIAILAAIAIPAYQDYLIRSEVSEGAVLTDGAKTAVSEFYANKGHFPASNASAGLAASGSISGKYVGQVVVGTAGLITATMDGPQVNTKVSGDVFVLSPVDTGGSINWTCNPNTAVSGMVPVKYLPSSCHN